MAVEEKALDIIEINEAFVGQVLGCLHEGLTYNLMCSCAVET